MLTPTIVDNKLKELGISADDEIAEVSAPPSDSTSRNSPCSCGSGKNLKIAAA